MTEDGIKNKNQTIRKAQVPIPLFNYMYKTNHVCHRQKKKGMDIYKGVLAPGCF